MLLQTILIQQYAVHQGPIKSFMLKVLIDTYALHATWNPCFLVQVQKQSRYCLHSLIVLPIACSPAQYNTATKDDGAILLYLRTVPKQASKQCMDGWYLVALDARCSDSSWSNCRHELAARIYAATMSYIELSNLNGQP